MFVLPAMMLKGLHWGYTRFYLGYYFKPVSYTDDDKLRRFDKEGYVPVVPQSMLQQSEEENTEGDGKSLEDGGITACPVAPILWLFGLHKAKKPANHEVLAKSGQKL